MSDTSIFERDRAYQLLLDQILGGEFDPGEPLSERKLADSLGMGRTPVREAIKRLTAEGLLTVRPARGTYVNKLTPADVTEIYEVRFGLEGTAAYLAAERGPTDEFSRYRRTFVDMIERPESYDLNEIHRCGQEFHVEMFRAARNRYLLDIYEPMRLRHSVTLGLPRHYDHGWVLESVREHLGILDAIVSGDPAVARQLVCDHLVVGLEVRSRIFETLHVAVQPDLYRKVVGA